eukprot:5983338-Pyramimonas_sp.AAC.1
MSTCKICRFFPHCSFGETCDASHLTDVSDESMVAERDFSRLRFHDFAKLRHCSHHYGMVALLAVLHLRFTPPAAPRWRSWQCQAPCGC